MRLQHFQIFILIMLPVFPVSQKLMAQSFRELKIGEQVWMDRNLQVETEMSRAYNDNERNARRYGRLYTWEAAKKACPPGWRLPSDEDWTELIEHLGGHESAAVFFARSGRRGFNAVMAGDYHPDHGFRRLGTHTHFWSATPGPDGETVVTRSFYKSGTIVGRNTYNPNAGFSVRCIKE